MMNDFLVTTLLFTLLVENASNGNVAFNESAFQECFVAARIVNCYENSMPVIVGDLLFT